MIEAEATQIATAFLESNGYVVGPADHRGGNDPTKPALYCGGTSVSRATGRCYLPRTTRGVCKRTLSGGIASWEETF
jgi:hypothetical protein